MPAPGKVTVPETSSELSRRLSRSSTSRRRMEYAGITYASAALETFAPAPGATR